MREAFRPTDRSELLADALCETIAELRLIDAGDLIAYIRAEQWANIADLVDSSSELSLRQGALSFACSADYVLGWDETPSISLDLEFQCAAISAFFTLTLGRRHCLVDLKCLWFAAAPSDAEQGTATFAQAIADARLRSSAPPWIFVERR